MVHILFKINYSCHLIVIDLKRYTNMLAGFSYLCQEYYCLRLERKASEEREKVFDTRSVRCVRVTVTAVENIRITYFECAFEGFKD